MDGQLAAPAGSPEQTNREMFHELLFGADGLVSELQATVQFGLASHYVPSEGFPLLGECPKGVVVPAEWNNAPSLMDAYENDIPFAAGTTWASMQEIAERIDEGSAEVHQTVMLIQSGVADETCDFSSAPDLQRAAVESLASLGVKVSVISLLYVPGQAQDAEGFNQTARELAAQLANIGGGEAFASDQASRIREAVEGSVADAVSCEITLEGEVETGQECQGEVLLGGGAVPCNDPDGFRLLDASTLELTGGACERLRSDASATLSARFPCDVFVPLI